MALYSYNGEYPRPIPYRIVLSNGLTRTDPASFTPEELVDAGYTEVSNRPSITDTQVLEWDDVNIAWVIRDKTQEELDLEAAKIRQNTIDEINRFRDNLIRSGFVFNGYTYGSEVEDQKRISAAALLAFMAISSGAQPDDFNWHGNQEPFAWITKDNQVVPMDAFTVVEFGKVAAEHERKLIFIARLLKDADPIPENWSDDVYWSQ